MTNKTHKPTRLSGKVLAISLLVVVLGFGSLAVWKIAKSTQDTDTNPPTDSISVAPPSAPPGMPAYQLTEADIEALKAKGLTDPVNDLLDDLKDHPELLPAEGTLGGTMKFWPSESRVISPSRVEAYYEDGHTGGRLLLEYEINDGEISWTVVQRLPN